ncbi:hypothetical protein [Brevundimonas naejangsanensis]|uniref:hypothetical protein n=1 Tax=Brevundimonas naejangsanensis TaxID=588932 RepID=UPI0013C463F3|nr:hypothetical protein [Brevundimonas naejangsanensis]
MKIPTGAINRRTRLRSERTAYYVYGMKIRDQALTVVLSIGAVAAGIAFMAFLAAFLFSVYVSFFAT